MSHFQNVWNAFYSWGSSWGGAGAVIGMVLAAIWFFTPPFLSSMAARAMLLNLALACIAFAFLSAYYTKVGYQSCADDTIKRDTISVERKEQRQNQLNLCRAGGGDWDIISGSCIKGIPK